MKKLLLILASSLIYSNIALSRDGILVNPAFLPAKMDTSADSDNRNDHSNLTDLKINMSAGVEFPNQVFLGAKLIYWDQSFKGDYRDKNSGAEDEFSQKDNTTGYGATIGYHPENGFFADLSYLFAMGRKITSDYRGDDKRVFEEKKGSAYALDLGYGMKFTDSVMFGPQILYLQYNYKREETTIRSNGVKADFEDEGTFKETSIMPFFGVWIYF